MQRFVCGGSVGRVGGMVVTISPKAAMSQSCELRIALLKYD